MGHTLYPLSLSSWLVLERKHEIEGKSPPCRVSDLVRTTPSIVSKHERRSGGVPIPAVSCFDMVEGWVLRPLSRFVTGVAVVVMCQLALPSSVFERERARGWC